MSIRKELIKALETMNEDDLMALYLTLVFATNLTDYYFPSF